MSELVANPDPASAAAIVPARNPVTVYDWAHGDFVWKSDELIAQGFQPLSLSVYGDPENALFAGSCDKRPGPQLRRAIGYTIDDFVFEQTQNQNQGFYPILVTATGGGRVGARISGYFAKRADPTQLTIHDNAADFGDEVQRRRDGNWVPLSVTVFSDAANTHSSMFAAIWETNTANVAWNVVAEGLTHDEHQKY